MNISYVIYYKHTYIIDKVTTHTHTYNTHLNPHRNSRSRKQKERY